MFDNPPRQIDCGTLVALNELISEDGYRIIRDPSLLPPEIANYCGSSHLCTLLIGTRCYQEPDSVYSANGPSWVVKTFRSCKHNGTAHFNSELRLYYQGHNGKSWMTSSNQNPDHYIDALTGTTLQDAQIATSLPSHDIGQLKELGLQSHHLNTEGCWPDFSMPYWYQGTKGANKL